MSSCSATRFTLPCFSPVSARSCTTRRTARSLSSGEYLRCDGLDFTSVFIALILIQRSRASTDPRAVQLLVVAQAGPEPNAHAVNAIVTDSSFVEML